MKLAFNNYFLLLSKNNYKVMKKYYFILNGRINFFHTFHASLVHELSIIHRFIMLRYRSLDNLYLQHYVSNEAKDF